MKDAVQLIKRNTMSSNLALLLGIGFIIVCIRQHTKNDINVPASLWIFTIWFFIIGSRPLMLWINPSPMAVEEAYDNTGGSMANIIFFLAFTVIAAITLARRGTDILSIIKSNTFLFVLLAYCGISCVWSDYPFTSFRRWIRMIFEIVVVLAIVSDANRTETLKCLLSRYSSVAIPLSLVLLKYFPHLGTAWSGSGMKMWTGVATHKNAFGAAMGVCIIFFLWKTLVLKDRSCKYIDFILMILSAYMLYNPEGKGSITSMMSIFSALLSIIIMLKLKKQINYTRLVLYGTIVSYLLLDVGTSLLFNKSNLEIIITSLGRDMTFTGRTEIWETVLRVASQSPIIGVGYGTFWSGSRYFQLWNEIGVTSAHNGYIEVYADIGLIGLILLILAVVASMDHALKNLEKDFHLNTFNVAIIIYVISSSFFEASFLQPSGFRWVIFLIAIINVPRDKNRSMMKRHNSSFA